MTYGWATPAKMRKKCCYGQKNLGQYVAVCLRLQLTSHTRNITLSRIKCERYIFIKKCVRSFIEVRILCLIMFLLNYTATCLPSRKPSKLDEPDVQDTAGEAEDELISDVLLWIPTYSRAKAGRPARTYIQQLCEDMGCSPEDLPEVMNDKEKWRERVRDIRASGMTWWWWWWWWCFCLYLYMYMYAIKQQYVIKQKKPNHHSIQKMYSILFFV